MNILMKKIDEVIERLRKFVSDFLKEPEPVRVKVRSRYRGDRS